MKPQVADKKGKTPEKTVQDDFLTILKDLYQKYILKNLKIIAAGVLTIVIVVAGILGWNAYQQGQNEKALLLETEARDLLKKVTETAASETKAPDAKTFKDVLALHEQLLAKYPGTESAERVRYLSGDLEYTQGNYDAAQQHFSTYLSKYPNGRYRVQAAMNIGYIFEQKGEFQKALDHLNSLEANAPAFLKSQLWLDIARNYEQLKQTDQALKVYQQVLDANISSFWKEKAQERVAFLKPGQVAAPAAAPQPEKTGAETPNAEATPTENKS